MKSRIIALAAVLVLGGSASPAFAQTDDIEKIEYELQVLLQDAADEVGNDTAKFVFTQDDDEAAKVAAEKKALEAALRRHEAKLAEMEARLVDKENRLRVRELELRAAAEKRAVGESAKRELEERLVELDVERARAAARAAELAARRSSRNTLRFGAPRPGAGSRTLWSAPTPFGPRSGGVGVAGSPQMSSITIRSENGDLTVHFDGEQVDPSRIRKTDDGLQILAPDGTVEREILLGIDSSQSFDLLLQEPIELKKRPIIGVQLAPLTDAVRHHTNLSSGRGVMIASLVEGRPAAAAGLEKYDVILSVDEKSVGSATDVSKAIQSKSPGDQVKLEIQRGSARMAFTVEVAEGEVSAAPSSGLLPTPGLPILGDVPMLWERTGPSTGWAETDRDINRWAAGPEIADIKRSIDEMLIEHQRRLEEQERRFHEMMKKQLRELHRSREVEKVEELEQLEKLHEELMEKERSGDEL